MLNCVTIIMHRVWGTDATPIILPPTGMIILLMLPTPRARG
jgi:hypothetical protein